MLFDAWIDFFLNFHLKFFCRLQKKKNARVPPLNRSLYAAFLQRFIKRSQGDLTKRFFLFKGDLHKRCTIFTNAERFGFRPIAENIYYDLSTFFKEFTRKTKISSTIDQFSTHNYIYIYIPINFYKNVIFDH